MNSRDKVLIKLTALALILLVGGKYLILGQLETSTQLDEKIESTTQTVKTTKNNIKKIHSIKNEIDAWKITLADITKGFEGKLNDEELDSLITSIELANNLSPSSLQIGDTTEEYAKPYSNADQSLYTDTGKKVIITKITCIAEGSETDIANFLDSIQTDYPSIHLDNYELSGKLTYSDTGDIYSHQEIGFNVSIYQIETNTVEPGQGAIDPAEPNPDPASVGTK